VVACHEVVFFIGEDAVELGFCGAERVGKRFLHVVIGEARVDFGWGGVYGGRWRRRWRILRRRCRYGRGSGLSRASIAPKRFEI
jgi:hypothetical protein